MKFITPLPLLVTTFMVSFIPLIRSSSPYNLAKDHLRGRVKSVTELEYKDEKPTNGIPRNDLIKVLEPERKIFELYNTDGNKLVRRVYWPYPELSIKDSFIYSSNRVLVKQITLFTHLSRGPNNFIYKYDEKGILSERDFILGADSLAGKTIYEYDGGGHKTKEKDYTPNGELKNESTFDPNGYSIEWQGYDHSKAIKDKMKFKRDKSGNLIENCTYDEQDHLLDKKTYKYDDNGNELEEYDLKMGDKDKEEDYSYEYLQFDKTGNWVKRSLIDYTLQPGGNPLKYIQERQIEYY